jgi:hypothetical protein
VRCITSPQCLPHSQQSPQPAIATSAPLSSQVSTACSMRNQSTTLSQDMLEETGSMEQCSAVQRRTGERGYCKPTSGWYAALFAGQICHEVRARIN